MSAIGISSLLLSFFCFSEDSQGRKGKNRPCKFYSKEWTVGLGSQPWIRTAKANGRNWWQARICMWELGWTIKRLQNYIALKFTSDSVISMRHFQLIHLQSRLYEHSSPLFGSNEPLSLLLSDLPRPSEVTDKKGPTLQILVLHLSYLFDYKGRKLV